MLFSGMTSFVLSPCHIMLKRQLFSPPHMHFANDCDAEIMKLKQPAKSV